MSATKFDTGKPRLELIPAAPMVEIARVLEFGARKYGVNNHTKGMQWSRLIGSLKRHLLEFELGNDTDEETGYSHLAHLVTNALFLMEYVKNHKELDDRPNKIVTNV